MSNIKGFNTLSNKNKMKRLLELYNDLYYKEDFLVGMASNYIHVTNQAFKDLAVKGTVRYNTEQEPDEHLRATTSNNISIACIMEFGEIIEDYIK